MAIRQQNRKTLSFEKMEQRYVLDGGGIVVEPFEDLNTAWELDLPDAAAISAARMAEQAGFNASKSPIPVLSLGAQTGPPIGA